MRPLPSGSPVRRPGGSLRSRTLEGLGSGCQAPRYSISPSVLSSFGFSCGRSGGNRPSAVLLDELGAIAPGAGTLMSVREVPTGCACMVLMLNDHTCTYVSAPALVGCLEPSRSHLR